MWHLQHDEVELERELLFLFMSKSAGYKKRRESREE